MAGFNIGGYFWAEGVDWNGRKFRRKLKNGITLGALNSILSVYFSSASPMADWYIGLIDNTSFTGLANADTMASHAGWIENVAFSNANRPAWNAGTVAGQTLSSTSNSVFNMTSDQIIQGLFIASDNTLNGTTGLLWSTGLFPAGPQTLLNGQAFSVGYTLAVASN